MQRYTLVGRMYGIDYPDPSAWESRRKEESERESSMKVFTVALIGAGNRGEIYTDIMKTLPEKFRVVAVADPNENHRRNIQNKHNLPDNHVFHTWQELLAQPRLADLAVIATQDSMHYEPAMKALADGYDVLLENRWRAQRTNASICLIRRANTAGSSWSAMYCAIRRSIRASSS